MKKGGSSSSSKTASNSLAAPPNQLQVRRSSAPGSADSHSKGGAGHGGSGGGGSGGHGATSPPGAASLGVGLLFKGGAKSAASSPVGGVPIFVGTVPSGGGGAAGGSAATAGAGGGDKSGSPRHRTSNDAWVCPNDRQLALRAK